MKLTDYKVLSFDCYGTLIDWESGMYKAYQPLLAKRAESLTRDEVLEIHARHEALQEEETPSLIYSKLLERVFARVALAWGLQTTKEECTKFGHSIQNWPAFVDSAAALQYLKKYYKLVILSNIDKESFKASNQRLQVEFDSIYQ